MNEMLTDIIDGGRVPGYAEAEALMRTHPACVIPAIAALKSPGLTPDERRSLSEKVALAIGEREAIMRVLGEDGDRFDQFYPDARHITPGTVATIDDFLDRFAAPVPPVALDDGLPDSDLLYNIDEIEQTDHEDESSAINLSDEDESAEEVEISEENAMLMIKKRDYRAALEIISALGLNNPEKSVYFADQIRFLRKLIINDKNNK